MRLGVWITAVVLGVGGCGAVAHVDSRETRSTMHVYLGSYTQDRSEGVFHFTFDVETGALTRRGAYGGVTNPSFLALHPDGGTLYAVAEAGRDDGATAFAIDAETGGLTLLNTQTTDGRAACHVAVDPTGRAAVVSYYGSGSVASFPLLEDGWLGPAVSVHRHEGSSIDAQRQEGPHAHSTNFDATGRFAVTADLGLDQLVVYAFDAETGELTPHDPPFAAVHGGAGPRHLAFHPTLAVAYVINELDATVTTLAWDAAAGTLTPRQTVSTLPEGYDGRRSCAEVVVHPSGRFVYGSNRGHDSLAAFAVDPEDGALSPLGHFASGGEEPRNFNIDPSGRWLIACNQNTDNVQVFAVDEETGGLTPTGEPVSVPMPVCVRFREGVGKPTD
ncbi:MAG: lactonase family protein [Planctomycetota bacterium]